MGELKLAGPEVILESGLGCILLLVEDGADSKEVIRVHYRCGLGGWR